MAKYDSLIGNRYGRLVVLDLDSIRKNRSYWKCQCDCGKTVARRSDSLKQTSSCGCLKSDMLKERMTTHGESNTSLYAVWHGVVQRCENKNHSKAQHYVGRGITLYKPWREDFLKFKEYVSQLEHYGEKGYTLDRINNDGNYEPNNVRWATMKEQAVNKRTNHKMTCNGKTLTVKEWGEELNVSPSTLHERLRHGWTDEDTLLKPINKKHRKAI